MSEVIISVKMKKITVSGLKDNKLISSSATIALASPDEVELEVLPSAGSPKPTWEVSLTQESGRNWKAF